MRTYNPRVTNEPTIIMDVCQELCRTIKVSNLLNDENAQLIQLIVPCITRRAFSRAHTSPPTLTFDLGLPKFNHFVPSGQGYDWPSGEYGMNSRVECQCRVRTRYTSTIINSRANTTHLPRNGMAAPGGSYSQDSHTLTSEGTYTWTEDC